ncbi:MAG: right-handed parallel beta-helix repeat-containing protein, partial [Planctomycetota bacterium]
MRHFLMIVLAASFAYPVSAREYHVSARGRDTSAGSASRPFKTISAAARVARPGDVITVHEGTYRERINPPRGGTSDTKRITYRAAEGEKVVVKGSEVVSGWKKTQEGVWKATLPNTFFGDYNPYKDQIKGDWFNRRGRVHHTGEVYLDGEALFEEVSLDKTARRKMSWYCESDDKHTHIWANFGDSDPSGKLVEINARPTCFYPDAPGRSFITVRGFTMRHAATQWAAPTAEQIALVGTHWSKGWIIEDNVISDSKCVGVTLGKDRASGHNNAQSAGGYNVVVKRALKGGWSKEKIGSHIVRNNTIHNCGAAGICGSMGGAFSRITGNHIYRIHLNKPFTGAEMAGIKLHAPIDTLIANNRIHDTCRGIWLDWMTQGTRVTANLLYRNRSDDLFVEVNHGPFVVDNNICLSRTAMNDWSQGGAFSHNL